MRMREKIWMINLLNKFKWESKQSAWRYPQRQELAPKLPGRSLLRGIDVEVTYSKLEQLYRDVVPTYALIDPIFTMWFAP